MRGVDFVPTHTGVVSDRAAGKRGHPVERRVELRETKLFFVTRSGDKFRKVRGTRPGDDYLWRRLLTETVEPIQK